MRGSRRVRGRGEGFLRYMKQLHISCFVSFSSYFLSAYSDSLCVYLDFSITFSFLFAVNTISNQPCETKVKGLQNLQFALYGIRNISSCNTNKCVVIL